MRPFFRRLFFRPPSYNLPPGASLLPLVQQPFQWANSIRKNILQGHALVVGAAILGYAVGDFMGDSYAKQASQRWIAANQEEQLLSSLNLAVLAARSHQQQLIPLLQQPEEYMAEHAHFLTHIALIRSLLAEVQTAVATHSRFNHSSTELEQWLKTYGGTIDSYSQELKLVLQQIDPLALNPTLLPKAQEQLLTFTNSVIALKLDRLSDDLTVLIEQARRRENQAAQALESAESLHELITLGSLLVSGVIAIFLAWQTSRAIAEPIAAVTQVAQQAEQEIRDALAQEQELNQLRSHFISTVSHEFRTPLTVIISSTDLLKRYQNKFTLEKKNQHLDKIQTASKYMTQLLAEILLMHQIEANQLQFAPANFDLAHLCQELVEALQLTLTPAHTILLQYHRASNFACLDAKLLRYILTHLLSNAVKYSPQGGQIQFEVSGDAKTAVFQIQDAGLGIPEGDREHILEPFHRAANVGNLPGAGLGLSIVKNCVDLHHGQLAIASEIEVGTTVTVTLPLNLTAHQSPENS